MHDAAKSRSPSGPARSRKPASFISTHLDSPSLASVPPLFQAASDVSARRPRHVVSRALGDLLLASPSPDEEGLDLTMKRKQDSSASKPNDRSKAEQQQQPRSRTFTGCRTCRSRHFKCDEARPSCFTCRRLNIACDGYTPSLLWMTEQSTRLDEQRGSSHRYPLFDEMERACMSLELAESLGTASAGRVVTDLDAQSVHDAEFHCIGPFGVFRTFDKGNPPPQTVHSISSSSPEEIDPQPLPVDLQYQQQQQHIDRSSFSLPDDDDAIQPPLEPLPLDTPLDLGQLPGPGADLASEIEDWMQLGACVGNGSSMFMSLDTFGMNSILSPRSGTPVAQESPSRRASPPRLERMPATDVITEIPRNMTVAFGSLPTHTPFLLRHLKEQVLEGSPATINRLSPWKVLFLPRALEIFAEMSLWNSSSFTRRSILSSLLSKSAYHLHKSSDSGTKSTRWLEVAAAHQQEAQEHLKSALATEFLGENQAEYTEMLMAMMGVGFAKLQFNDPRAVKKLLLDIERLIRLRGIPLIKRHSLRVLHHMYTNLRIIAESTSLRPLIQAAQNGNSSGSEMSADYISALVPQGFRLDESNLGDLDYTRAKTIDVGYNDIHLEVSGYWQPTLYPEMYGVPESLMTLLSQTISLANEKPNLAVAALNNPAISIALSQHTRSLEQQLWSWTPSPSELPPGPGRPPSLVGVNTPPLDKSDARSMILGIHQAVIIFFYRRVYNMSAMIIQEQVRKTLDYLQPIMDIGGYDQDFAIIIGWSCFIAACEAISPDLQQRGLECLQTMDASGVFVETSKPSEIAKSVWEQRSCSGDMTFSWPDLQLQQQCAL